MNRVDSQSSAESVRLPALMAWSGGKDSALALHRIRMAGAYDVHTLLTTVNAVHHRVSMHGVREEVLDAQAAAIGLPLEKVYVPDPCTNDDYARRMGTAMRRHRDAGIRHVIFGDIFLTDLRAWREAQLRELDMEAVFPLWGEETRALYVEGLSRGFRSSVCCVNDAWLGPDAIGRELDQAFLDSLPGGADPCGENGEYHTCVFDGPIFRRPLRLARGEVVYRPLDPPMPVADGSTRVTRGFWYGDLLLATP